MPRLPVYVSSMTFCHGNSYPTVVLQLWIAGTRAFGEIANAEMLMPSR